MSEGEARLSYLTLLLYVPAESIFLVVDFPFCKVNPPCPNPLISADMALDYTSLLSLDLAKTS